MEDVTKYLEEGRAIDLFVAYRFLRILTTPWEDQDAFKHGIIDKDGKLRIQGCGQLKNKLDSALEFISRIPGIVILNCHPSFQPHQ